MVFLRAAKTLNINKITARSSLCSSFVFNRVCVNAERFLSTQNVTANLHFYSEKPRLIIRNTKSLRLGQETNGEPLVLIFSWFQAKPKDLEKYCSIYTALGYDVLVVRINTMQFLRPAASKGAQEVAGDVLTFLLENDYYKRILLHGFSIGGYFWGECLVKLRENGALYGSIEDRIKCQIWDSVAGLRHIPIGVGNTFFPDNEIMKKSLKTLNETYLKIFNDQATKHFIKSEDFFHSKPIQAPALMFYSKPDLIGTESFNLEMIKAFEANGLRVSAKCFDDSPHVGHFRKYKEKYLELLMRHLQSCDLIHEKKI